jgi:hypothetical protein
VKIQPTTLLGGFERMLYTEPFRVLAALLAAGGIFFSILCAGIVFEERDVLALLVFAPGFVITAGYVSRCFYTPQLFWLRIIWGASAIVQGGWLIYYFAPMAYRAFQHKDDTITSSDFINLMTLWWLFALVISICGFFYDKKRAA